MADIIVDTNVWITAAKPAADARTVEEVDCIRHCSEWIREFLTATDTIVIDSQGVVLREYMRYLSPGRLTDPLMTILYSEIWARMKYLDIEFDDDGFAVLPTPVRFHDPSDRVFVALALACDPPAPIYNATDTDWRKERAQLSEHGLRVIELCEDFIAAMT